MKKFLLIVGHGSRSEDAVKVFNQLVEEVRKKGIYDHVDGAHMEMTKPGIKEMAGELAEKKPDMIIIAPYFLYEGIHIKKDIPEIISELTLTYPEIEFKMARPIGFEPCLADIILNRAEEASGN